jgi:hypothetical protein
MLVLPGLLIEPMKHMLITTRLAVHVSPAMQGRQYELAGHGSHVCSFVRISPH